MQAVFTLNGALMLWIEKMLYRQDRKFEFESEKERNGFIIELIGSFNKNVNPIQEKKAFSEFNKKFFAVRKMQSVLAYTESRSLASWNLTNLPEAIEYFTGLYMDSSRAKELKLVEKVLAKRADEIYGNAAEEEV